MDNHDVINEFLEEARPGRPTTVELAHGLVAGHGAGPRESVVITLQKDIDEPVRAESPAPSHVFSSLTGFAEYLNAYGSDDLLVMVDPETGRMDGVLDETAEDGLTMVSFRPTPHPLLSPWSDLIDGQETIQIKEFCRFIAANKSVIRQPKASDLAMVFKQIRLSKNVTVHEGRGAESINGVIVEMKVQGGQMGQVPINLPETITIQCPLFADETEAMEIQVDLSLDVGSDDRVRVQMTSNDLTVKRLRSVRDLRDVLAGQIKSRAIVSLGRVQREPWKYLNR